MLTEIGESDDIPHVLGVGLRIHDPHLDPRDVHPGIRNRQALHGLVVLIEEVLREEIVPVGFVVVSTDVELLRLGAAFNFDLLALAFLLGENGRVVQTSPLGLQLDTEQTLAPRNQGSREGHGNVPRLEIFQDVILFPLEANVHLVLKIEERFRIVIRSQVNFVANLSTDVELDALVKIKRRDAALAFGNPRVLGVGNVDTKREFRRTLGLYFDFVAAENGFEQFAVHRQLWGERTLRLIVFGLEVIPIFRQVAGDVVVEVFVERQERRRPVQQGVANALLDAVQARGFVEDNFIVEILRPSEIKARWTLRWIVLILPTKGEWQDDGKRVVRCFLCGLSPHA